MDFFKITADVLKKANGYMPMATKADLCENIAKLCVKPSKTAEQNKAGEKLLAMPCIMIEDYALKELLLMNTLIGYYFDIEIENGEDAYATYDFYAGGNIVEQLKHFKGDEELREKAFAIVEDFRRFKKMVDTEIYNRKLIENDSLARFTAAIQVGSSPEFIQQALETLKDIDIEQLKGQLKIPTEKENSDD